MQRLLKRIILIVNKWVVFFLLELSWLETLISDFDPISLPRLGVKIAEFQEKLSKSVL